MFQFGKMEPVFDSPSSFVGVKRENGDIKLYLPTGYKEEKYDSTYSNNKRTFFLLYNLLRAFDKNTSSLKDNDYFKSLSAKDREGVFDKAKAGVNHDLMSILGYTPFKVLDEMVESFDRVDFLSAAIRRDDTSAIDWDNIYESLDRAVFLENDTIFLDAQERFREYVQEEYPFLIELYAYVASEVQSETGVPHDRKQELRLLTERFVERTRIQRGMLFDESLSDSIVGQLREELEVAYKRDTIKSDVYYSVYDTLNGFLYPNQFDGHTSHDEVYFGINVFWPIWESMCLCSTKGFPEFMDVAYADPDTPLQHGYTNRLSFNLIIGGAETTLRPDVVFETQPAAPVYDIYVEEWDDYGHQTCFRLRRAAGSKKEFKMAHISQKGKGHTIKYFDQEYEYNSSTKISVSRNDLREFYSYMSSSDIPYETGMMVRRDFNDILFLAYREGNVDSEEKLLRFINELPMNNDTLRASLFRDCSDEYIYKVYCELKLYLDTNPSVMREVDESELSTYTIVDAKYKPSRYYLDKDNYQETIDRDIRKQFVYEYVCKFQTGAKVESVFWLPSQVSDEESMSQSSVFVCRGIRLLEKDFSTLAEFYIKDSFSSFKSTLLKSN